MLSTPDTATNESRSNLNTRLCNQRAINTNVAIPDGSADVSGEVFNKLALRVGTEESSSSASQKATLPLIQAPTLAIPFSKIK